MTVQKTSEYPMFILRGTRKNGQCVARTGRVSRRDTRHARITAGAFAGSLERKGLPERNLLFFIQVLEGRNAQSQDGVLGREVISFGEYGRRTAALGIWNA